MRSLTEIVHNGRSLADILAAHEKFLRGDDGGERANLWRVNLQGANLQGANLQGADLRGANLWMADLRGTNLRGANLRGVDLRDVDLRGANLWGATGNMREIKSMHIDTWPVAWVRSSNGETTVQIGCQRHPLEMWRKADPRWIAALDRKATEWWTQHGTLLLAMIDANPATPYGKAKEAT